MDITNVNCIPMGIFTCFFAKKLQNRSKKAAIVNISSYSSVRSMPYMAIYAATKSFNDTFSRCVSREDQKNDILSVVALKVISGSVK